MAICISVGDGDTHLLLPPLSFNSCLPPLFVTEHSHFFNDVRIFTLFPKSLPVLPILTTPKPWIFIENYIRQRTAKIFKDIPHS